MLVMADTSPFPGMDPYLEAYWSTIHAKICVYAEEALNEVLPAGLVARTERRIIRAGQEPDHKRNLQPDTPVFARSNRSDGDATTGSPGVLTQAGVSAATPIVVELGDDTIKQSLIELYDINNGERLVSSVEFISPTNKLAAGSGRADYLKKRRDVLRSGANLAEIDLTRRGPRERILPHPETLADVPATPYEARVTRAQGVDQHEWYPMPLADPLPAIRVPLRRGDPDVALPLQHLIDRAYRTGRYGQTLRYDRDPVPPLRGKSKRWADRLLRDAGLRTEVTS